MPFTPPAPENTAFQSRDPTGFPGITRKHWPALVLALLVGLNLASPALTAKIRYGIPFDHPANIQVADEFFYLARLREIVDGHPTLGNPYLWEHKSKPPSPVFLGEYLVALPIAAWQKLNNGGQPKVVAWAVFYDFLFPAFITLLIYSCLNAITRRRWLALLATVFLIWGLFPSDFIRLVSPQFNFIFWLSLFLLSYLLIRQDNALWQQRALVAALAFNFGALFYLYTYYWTFYLIFFLILAASLALIRERVIVANIVAVVIGGFVVAIPYFLIMLRAVRLPEYGQTIRRIGMIDTHFPSGISIVIPGFFILAALIWLLRKNVIGLDRQTVFFLSGVIAALVSVNQHVLTGKNLEFSSHYYLLSIFWFVFVGVYLLGRILDRAFISRPIAAIGVFVLTMAVALPNLLASASNVAVMTSPASSLARAIPLFDWINRFTAKDDVIMFIPFSFAGVAPIYTSANVYFSNGARLHFVSDEELVDRFIVNHFFTRIDEDLIRKNVRALVGVYDIDVAGHAQQENKVRRLLGLRLKGVEPFPALLPRRVFRREKELRAIGFESALKRYRVDYIVWDRLADAAVRFDAMPFLEKTGEVGQFAVFRLR